MTGAFVSTNREEIYGQLTLNKKSEFPLKHYVRLPSACACDICSWDGFGIFILGEQLLACLRSSRWETSVH